MEYSKETEKFSFGFGTDKAIGNAKVTDIHKAQNSPKSDKQEIAEVALSAAAVVGITMLKLIFDKKKKKSKKKKR